MFPLPRPSRRRAAPDDGAEPAVRDREATHLRVVDATTYADWESVYRDNVVRLYRLMYARVGNRADAEDLTSEVFSTALPPLRLASSKGEVRSYLLATATTVLAAHWRRRLGQPITSIDPDTDLAHLSDTGPAESQPGDAPQRADRILGALPERYRRILELRFLEACSVREAAQAMGVSVGNAKVLQHRALRMATQVAAELGS
jgi:RNA polymerase sigma factor (sigma-70 family)